MESKFVKPSAIKSTKKELKQSIPKGSYTETAPVTFYTEHLHRKNYYMSAGLGANPFARTCGMTQPVQKTRAVSKYEGNVNFLAEKATMSNFTFENDITKYNVHQDRKTEAIHTFQELKEMLWNKANENLQNGLIGLKRLFKKMDKNYNNYLEPLEFKEGMVKFGIELV